MKIGRKFLAVALASIFIVGSLTGCGGKTTNNDKGQGATDIEISLLYSGMGTEFLDKLIEGFNEKYPEYNAYYNTSASVEGSIAAFGLEDTDTIDLYMVCNEFDTTYLEPLDDVLDTTIEGESKSIREKFDSSYLEIEEVNGKVYNLTYGGGVLGMVYNKQLFEEAGIVQLPRTSDELALVCGVLSDNNITPLCHYAPYGYYTLLAEVWFAQYDGVEYYYDFYVNPTKEKMLEKDGRYEALEALEKIITPQNTVQGSNTESHISMQTKFMEGTCAMMYNGTWLANEMSSVGNLEGFDIMKTPVISSIVDKLTTVKKETELRKLITAIDNVTDGIESIDTYIDGDNYKVEGISVSSADWDYVKLARNTLPTAYPSSSSYIPTYSNAKEGAKDFLRYMYSDEGYQIYLEATHMRLPLELDKGEIDTTGWNAYEKRWSDIMNTMECSIMTGAKNQHPIYSYGGARSFAEYNYVSRFSTSNEADRLSADAVWKDIIAVINDNYESTWLKNIE